MNAGLSAYGAGVGPETGRLQVDGVGVGSGTSGTSQYRPDTIQANELVISSFGNLGEAEVGSPIVNRSAPPGRRRLRDFRKLGHHGG
jgi:hypothetical protein